MPGAFESSLVRHYREISARLGVTPTVRQAVREQQRRWSSRDETPDRAPHEAPPQAPGLDTKVKQDLETGRWKRNHEILHEPPPPKETVRRLSTEHKEKIAEGRRRMKKKENTE